ncbi:MAG: outer membrane protein assembly factor BamE [Campylobacteraceae bacterium]|jgi:outer membrane protein assembly factor BamE (lipoprotein component of BamABCDE complex)|nr:outer membrane protein assembly factor BamE [Campylobacteraceae bacterium]
MLLKNSTVSRIVGFVLVLVFLGGCSSLFDPKSDEQLTVAKAQKEIKVGMSSAEVIEVMGSPNIISTDSDRREVWVYDKISTQEASKSASGGLILFFSGRSSSSAKSQRTLTVIVKFDSEQKVRDVAYHTSSF